MFVVCVLGSEEVSDLVRLAQGAIPSRRAHGARIESANLNDRTRLRELFQSLATTTRLSVVVVHDGRIIAERYSAGMTGQTPLPGWSMSKSVMPYKRPWIRLHKNMRVKLLSR